MNIEYFIHALINFGNWLLNPFQTDSKANSITNNYYAKLDSLPLALYIDDYFYSKQMDGYYYGFTSITEMIIFFDNELPSKKPLSVVKKTPGEIMRMLSITNYAQVVPVFFNDLHGKL